MQQSGPIFIDGPSYVNNHFCKVYLSGAYRANPYVQQLL